MESKSDLEELVLGCFKECKLNERSPVISNLTLRDLIVLVVRVETQSKACKSLGISDSHSVLAKELTRMTGWDLMQSGPNKGHTGRIGLGKLLVQSAREYMTYSQERAQAKVQQKIVEQKAGTVESPEEQQPLNPVEQIIEYAKDPQLRIVMKAALSY